MTVSLNNWAGNVFCDFLFNGIYICFYLEKWLFYSTNVSILVVKKKIEKSGPCLIRSVIAFLKLYFW